MRYIGLDLGSKTLGVSLSDKLHFLASPYKVIRHENDFETLIASLKEIIEKEEVSKIILGYPKNMNNTIGESAKKVLEFKERLAKEFKMDIILEDERLTSKSSEAILINAGKKRNERKDLIDAVAATIILQKYMDRSK